MSRPTRHADELRKLKNTLGKALMAAADKIDAQAEDNERQGFEIAKLTKERDDLRAKLLSSENARIRIQKKLDRAVDQDDDAELREVNAPRYAEPRENYQLGLLRCKVAEYESKLDRLRKELHRAQDKAQAEFGKRMELNDEVAEWKTHAEPCICGPCIAAKDRAVKAISKLRGGCFDNMSNGYLRVHRWCDRCGGENGPLAARCANCDGQARSWTWFAEPADAPSVRFTDDQREQIMDWLGDTTGKVPAPVIRFGGLRIDLVSHDGG